MRYGYRYGIIVTIGSSYLYRWGGRYSVGPVKWYDWRDDTWRDTPYTASGMEVNPIVRRVTKAEAEAHIRRTKAAQAEVRVGLRKRKT